jgi:hypothetical protein
VRIRFLSAVAAVVFLAAPPASAQDQPPLPTLPNSAEIQLKVERDGALSVIEAISVPNDTSMTRTVPLRTASAHNRDRILGVRDVSIEGVGTSELSAGAFTVRLRGGTSVLRYTVDGAVSVDAGVVHVAWQVAGGWDTALKLIRASFAAPKIPDAVSCLIGAGTPCVAAQIDHAGLTRFSQSNLSAGQRMDVTVELPPGTVPANARLEPSKTIGGAFVLTEPVGWAWGGLVVVLGGAVAWLWWARRRDTRSGGALPVEVLFGEGESAVFASPDGVLPGHIGSVLAGRADAVELAATVLDLAVRNYLWISEEPGEDGLADWRLVRRNPADDQLGDFERAVFTVLLPGDTESVRLSELRDARIGIGSVRGELYDDLVRRRWFSRRPDQSRGKAANVGLRLCFYGLFLTVLLALTVGYAQLGVLAVVAGALLAFGARWLPARTTRGVLLGRRLRGLRDRLAATMAADVPKPERDLLFSRALPYALALGEAEHWVNEHWVSEHRVTTFDGLDSPSAPYWYEAGEHGARVGEFAAALVGTFAGGRTARTDGRSIQLAVSP